MPIHVRDEAFRPRFFRAWRCSPRPRENIDGRFVQSLLSVKCEQIFSYVRFRMLNSTSRVVNAYRTGCKAAGAMAMQLDPTESSLDRYPEECPPAKRGHRSSGYTVPLRCATMQRSSGLRRDASAARTSITKGSDMVQLRKRYREEACEAAAFETSSRSCR